MWWQILAADVLVSFALKAVYSSVSEPLNTLPSNGSPTEVTQPYLCASSFAWFAPDSLDLLNYCIYVVEVATIGRFLKCGRLSWMWRELKEWGFARRKWDSPLTGDWGAGGQRSVPGCFAPSVTPPIWLLFPATPNTYKGQWGLFQCAAWPSCDGNADGNCRRGWEYSWIATSICFPWLITQPEDILSQSKAYLAFSG